MSWINRIGEREHLWATAKTYTLAVATNARKIPLVCDEINDLEIIGLLVRRQSNEAGITRKSANGVNLLSRSAMAQAHMTFKKSSSAKVDKVPLEFFAFDPEIHGPGWYSQLLLPHGFNISDSVVEFADGAVTADEELEITFFTVDPDYC